MNNKNVYRKTLIKSYTDWTQNHTKDSCGSTQIDSNYINGETRFRL